MSRINLNQKEKELERQKFAEVVEEDEKFKLKIEREKASDITRRRKDFIRRLELERRESSLNGVVLKAQEVDALQNNQFGQEEKLALELDLLRRKEIADEKLRLYLRQNSHELKELESQLKAAYTKKAIATQLAEKQANKLENEISEKRAREIIERAVGTLEEQEEAQRLHEKKQKDEFRHSLQDQIIEKERLRQVEFLSFMKEKKNYDDILQKIKEDEERETEQKKVSQQKLKEEMEQFYIARAMWKAKERLLIQQEDEKIKHINNEKKRQREVAGAQELAKKSASEEISNKLLKEFLLKQKQKDEKEAIIATLMRYEIEEKENQRSQNEATKAVALREQVRADYKRALAEKSRRKNEEKEMEMQFAQQMKLRIDEEDKTEREKQEKRRQEQRNNLAYNKEAMRQNVQKRAENLKLTQMINELTEEEEERRIRLVQEERLKMLKEHAPKLLGYFPKGSLREQDLEALGITGASPLPESCPLEGRQNPHN
ncbi:hypothetical protein RUM44_005837 [Polyplax serrata]|uniref:Meiosis-specific nuclear structural protein 1 n=1 Tax=Polyplax serrata TaxID=468196 RepID=A0ABR1AY76_POLSC